MLHGMPDSYWEDVDVDAYGTRTAWGSIVYASCVVKAAKVLQRRWRHVVQLRRARERSRWSEVSRGHLNWRKSGCGQVHRRPKRPNARGGKWEFREAFLVDEAKAEAKAEAEMRRADEMLLAAAKSGDEELVCTLLAKGANLDCVEGRLSDVSYPNQCVVE